MSGWVGLRNRLLSNPRFQAWAAAFPPTRWQARREAQGLFDLVAGFVHAQVLGAWVELDLGAKLAGVPLTVAELAAACDLPPESMRRLVRAAAALRLAQMAGEAWTLGSRGAALQGNPGVAAMVAHHGQFYADMADPVALLRRGGGGLADYWAYERGDEAGAVGAYSALMAASQPMVAAQVLAAHDFQHRRLLDVGGGEGAFAAAVARSHPGLDVAVFDLPAVAARARVALDVAGLGRIAAHGGSFLDDPLPDGFDAVSLVRILHDHDDEPAARILRQVRAALPTGGTLLIAEPMTGTRPDTVGDAYFGFYLLAMGQGRARTPAELAGMLKTAGFASSRLVPTRLPLVARVIVAKA